MDWSIGLAWFKTTIAGNELWRFLAWLGGVLVALIVGRVVRYYLTTIAAVMEARHKPLLPVVLRALARAAVVALVALAFKLGLHFLGMSERMADFAATTTNVLIVAAVGYVLYCLVEVISAALAHAASKTSSKLDDMLVPMVRRSLQVTVTCLTLIQIATVLSDKPLTSVLAGLGVGGLAVALAAQETIKNFFGSITVLTDKPFELGDRVIVDGTDGAVEEVGFRSTRIRTLEGDLVTIPNGELANKAIRNAGKKAFFRRVINVGIPYNTPPEKVAEALAILKAILDRHPGMSPELPPRVHFNELTASALNINVIYWYSKADYWAYMDFSEKVNLEILRRFNAAGIAFAYPSQTLYLAGDKAWPVAVAERGPG
jgi:MscS family membrane protein